MKYSLSEAAKATGKNKTTVQRAIKNGKISASKGDSGSYEIEPSELHRVFPPVAAQRDAQHRQSNDTQQSKSASINSDLARVLELEKELAIAHESQWSGSSQGADGRHNQRSTETPRQLRRARDSTPD